MEGILDWQQMMDREDIVGGVVEFTKDGRRHCAKIIEMLSRRREDGPTKEAVLVCRPMLREGDVHNWKLWWEGVSPEDPCGTMEIEWADNGGVVFVAVGRDVRFHLFPAREHIIYPRGSERAAMLRTFFEVHLQDFAAKVGSY